MNRDEFAKAVRAGNEKYRADDLVIDTGSEKLTGKGYLLVKPTELVILMTLDAETTSLAEKSPGVVTMSDYWTMTGTIDHDLGFRCKCGPCPTKHYHNGVLTLEESVHPVELETKGWDRLTNQERRDKWKEINAALGKPATNANADAAETERLADSSFEFHANFVDHKLRFADEVTHTERKNPFFGNDGSGWRTDTLMGETSTYKFGLSQARENDDLRLVICSKENQSPLSEAEHLRKYHSFALLLLSCTGSMHGTTDSDIGVREVCPLTKSHPPSPLRERITRRSADYRMILKWASSSQKSRNFLSQTLRSTMRL